jgi:hypothetical protein
VEATDDPVIIEPSNGRLRHEDLSNNHAYQNASTDEANINPTRSLNLELLPEYMPKQRPNQN